MGWPVQPCCHGHSTFKCVMATNGFGHTVVALLALRVVSRYTELAKLTNHIDAFSDEGITAKMHDAALPDTCSETVNCKKTGLKNLFFYS